jgi:hypothetical protein
LFFCDATIYLFCKVSNQIVTKVIHIENQAPRDIFLDWSLYLVQDADKKSGLDAMIQPRNMLPICSGLGNPEEKCLRWQPKEDSACSSDDDDSTEETETVTERQLPENANLCHIFSIHPKIITIPAFKSASVKVSFYPHSVGCFVGKVFLYCIF